MEIVPYATTEINLKDIMLSKISQKLLFQLYEKV